MPYIIRSLSKLGKADMIHAMIMQKEHPSYYRFIEKGENTLPEFWMDDARSRKHDMMGHIMEWFFTDVAGITSDDGFKTVKINPELPSHITFVECEYHSVRGKIYVKIDTEKDDIIIKHSSNMKVIPQ